MSPLREGDEAQLLHGHHEEVEGAAGTARALALSRRQEARAESDLGRIARMEKERVRALVTNHSAQNINIRRLSLGLILY